MKFRVEYDVINNAVSWTARILPNRPRQPYLSGIKIVATDDGNVTFSGFDLTVSTQSTIIAEVFTPGEVIVSGRLLSDICKQLPNRKVEVSLEKNNVIITCGSSKFNLLEIPNDEYPKIPELPEKIGSVEAGIFSSAASQASMSVARDLTLPQINAVKVEISGPEVTFLATDRYRLTQSDFIWEPVDPEFSAETLIDAHFLSDVAKTLTTAGKIGIHFNPEKNNIIGFSTEGKHTSRTIIDGNYPAVKQLFPSSSETYVVISTEEIIKSLRRVSTVSSRGSAVKLSFSKGEVKLEAGQGEDAQASEVIPATLHGEDIVIAFKSDFLLDGLNAISTPYVRLSFTTPTKPTVITAQKELDGEDITDFRYLLMPTRTLG